MTDDPLVTLVGLTTTEVSAWLPGAMERLVAVRVAAGESTARATSMVSTLRESGFPDGAPAPGHQVLGVVVDGKRVGAMWISSGASPGSAERNLMLLELDSPTDSLVAASIQSAERWAVGDGATRLAVTIFGESGGDQALYDGLGYVVAATAMYKVLA